jgi:hypothetical protein
MPRARNAEAFDSLIFPLGAVRRRRAYRFGLGFGLGLMIVADEESGISIGIIVV